MTEDNPWYKPHKKNGNELKNMTRKWDTMYIQAVTEIAAEESGKWGVTIAFATLNMNLSTQRSAYFTEVRRRLNERVTQLTKEKQRHANTNQKKQQTTT